MLAPIRFLQALTLAALSSFAITAVGQGVWAGLVALNLAASPSIPWSAVAMAVVLVLLLSFLSGRTPPRANAAARARLMPFGPVSGRQWLWSLTLGAAGIAGLAILWITLGELVPVAPNRLPEPADYPPATIAAMFVMSCLAAPLSEEAAFRGYATGILRRVAGPWTTLVTVSLLFAIAHLTQGAYPTKLLVYFLVGLLFGFIAWRTGSLLPAMVVHSAADVTFFALVWPGDATRPHLSLSDPTLWIQVALVTVLAAGSLAAATGLTTASTHHLARDA